jgi:hypothetical protein
MRQQLGLVVSSKKVGTNRNNAKKSTGPKSLGGQSHSRLNALKHGAFAVQRLLPGESAKDYDHLSSQVFAETSPNTAIEIMLVDQIVGDMWRLKRVEQAERAYFEQIRISAIARTLRLLSSEEIQLIPNLLEDGEVCAANTLGLLRRTDLPHRPSRQPDSSGEGKEATLSSSEPEDRGLCDVRQELLAATDPDKLMLDGLVSASDSDSPYRALEQIRRSLVRAVLRKNDSLAELQGRRLAIQPRSNQ